MKAMVRKAFGILEQLVSKDVLIPTPGKAKCSLRVRRSASTTSLRWLLRKGA